jgi:tripartite-type tricarboxylate transporter receptor subunit TctC
MTIENDYDLLGSCLQDPARLIEMWTLSMPIRLLLIALSVLVLWPAHVLSQNWPTRTVRMIVPFPAGGAVDVLARTVFDKVSAALGQPFVIENRLGAGGTIGSAAVARAEPDGYTILVNSSSHTVAPALFSSLSYDAVGDFHGVIPLASLPTVLFVSASTGYKSLGDLVAAGKNKSLTYGSGGVGNATHLNAERFMLSAGFKAVHVPFKGSPEALAEVLSGRIDFSFSALLPAMALLEEGKLKALAVSSIERATALPDVPTTTEAGYSNSDYMFWAGVMVPRATSGPIIEKLHRETEKVLQLADVKAKIKMLGADPMPMSSADFDKLLADEVRLNKELVKAAGITVN